MPVKKDRVKAVDHAEQLVEGNVVQDGYPSAPFILHVPSFSSHLHISAPLPTPTQ